jgi:outer membrane protein
MKSLMLQQSFTRFILALLLTFNAAVAQSQSTVDELIKEGLKSNLVLQQKNVSLQQAEQSLRMARSYFLPGISFLADYTTGDGGRSIALPVGDLLNPVYATLNQMTQGDAFPQIENVEQNFFPQNFYDARVRTTLPIINTDLVINRNIQSRQVLLKQYEVEAYKRELVLDIKTACYNILAAEAAVQIYESAVALMQKNVEINESLLKNGKTLPANVIRARSEAQKITAELNSAKNRRANAEKYLNFLLNRELNTTVAIAEPLTNEELTASPITGSNTREELKMIKTAEDINESVVKMNQLNRLPKVNAFLDLGSQAYDWQYNDNSRYYLAGVQLAIPIFQGFRNNLNIRHASLELKKTQQQLSVTEKQLEMAVSVAQGEKFTAIDNYEAAQQQLTSAQSYFTLVDKGYKEGVNSLIEFLDARNQLTSSELQLSLRQYELLTAEAKLERETASYSFEN